MVLQAARDMGDAHSFWSYSRNEPMDLSCAVHAREVQAAGNPKPTAVDYSGYSSTHHTQPLDLSMTPNQPTRPDHFMADPAAYRDQYNKYGQSYGQQHHDTRYDDSPYGAAWTDRERISGYDDGAGYTSGMTRGYDCYGDTDTSYSRGNSWHEPERSQMMTNSRASAYKHPVAGASYNRYNGSSCRGLADYGWRHFNRCYEQSESSRAYYRAYDDAMCSGSGPSREVPASTSGGVCSYSTHRDVYENQTPPRSKNNHKEIRKRLQRKSPIAAADHYVKRASAELVERHEDSAAHVLIANGVHFAGGFVSQSPETVAKETECRDVIKIPLHLLSGVIKSQFGEAEPNGDASVVSCRGAGHTADGGGARTTDTVGLIPEPQIKKETV